MALSKEAFVNLLLAGATLAIESLELIVKAEGYEKAKLASDYAQMALEAIKDEPHTPPQMTFDAALAYADGVTLDQLKHWQQALDEESIPHPHIDAAIFHFEAALSKADGKEGE